MPKNARFRFIGKLVPDNATGTLVEGENTELLYHWVPTVVSLAFQLALEHHVGIGADRGGDEDPVVPGRVEDWRPCSIGSAYPFLPVSVGSASLSEP